MPHKEQIGWHISDDLGRHYHGQDLTLVYHDHDRAVEMAKDFLRERMGFQRQPHTHPTKNTLGGITEYRQAPDSLTITENKGLVIARVQWEFRDLVTHVTHDTVTVNGQEYSRQDEVQTVVRDWTPLTEIQRNRGAWDEVLSNTPTTTAMTLRVLPYYVKFADEAQP